MKFATKLYNITHLTFGMLLHYLGKSKILIFCRYSADMEENANKLHFYHFYLCYLSTNFDIFSVYNSEFFPTLIANKIFHVTAFEHLLFTINGRENLTNTVTQIQNIYIPITIITYDV